MDGRLDQGTKRQHEAKDPEHSDNPWDSRHDWGTALDVASQQQHHASLYTYILHGMHAHLSSYISANANTIDIDHIYIYNTYLHDTLIQREGERTRESTEREREADREEQVTTNFFDGNKGGNSP